MFNVEMLVASAAVKQDLKKESNLLLAVLHMRIEGVQGMVISLDDQKHLHVFSDALYQKEDYVNVFRKIKVNNYALNATEKKVALEALLGVGMHLPVRKEQIYEYARKIEAI